MAEHESLETGDRAPAFCLPDQNENKICLKDFLGKWAVLYFYPRDNTPGCTREAVEFTRAEKKFKAANAVIIGISPDSSQSHFNFAEKHSLTITLLSDPNHAVLQQCGAWRLKKLYGREYFGVVRSTFLIDPEGKIAHIWEKVKVRGHVEDVLQTLKEAQNFA